MMVMSHVSDVHFTNRVCSVLETRTNAGILFLFLKPSLRVRLLEASGTNPHSEGLKVTQQVPGNLPADSLSSPRFPRWTGELPTLQRVSLLHRHAGFLLAEEVEGGGGVEGRGRAQLPAATDRRGTKAGTDLMILAVDSEPFGLPFKSSLSQEKGPELS